jgi:hypothetical protein
MNLFDVVFGLLGIVMVIRLGQLIANASQRKSLLKLGKQVLIVVVTLILITIYFYSRIFG